MATTDDQAAIQRNLDRLQTTPGMEEAFVLHKAVNSSTIRIFRFLCEDQEWLDCVPEADGSNFEYLTPWMDTYLWFREWLSVCHYQNVLRWQIVAPLGEASANLRLEKRTHYLDIIEAETKRSLDMQPFRRLYDQQAAALAVWGGDGMVPLMDPDCEILAELMIAEGEFNDPLCGTHVEDVLLEKRFDRDQLDDGLRDDPLLEIRRIHECEREGWWIRQLRQHGFRRPWKQLYLVLDDGISQEYAQAIDDVAALFRNPRIERALDVQPIALSAMRDKNCAVMCGRHDDDEAGTSADFGEGDTAMLQFCGTHWIHGSCAFQAWDVLGQNNFSFPCPMCRKDAGRLSDKLDIDIVEGNYNVGFDPEKEQEDAFRMIQETFQDDYTLLERQHEFPVPARRKALREQKRLLDYADEQDRYYDNILANWDTNPQNQNMRKPVHPKLRELHHHHYYHLYEFDEDDDPPRFEEAHWHEEALEMIEDGTRPPQLPAHLLTAWRQWMDREGWEQLIGAADVLMEEMGDLGGMLDFGRVDDSDDVDESEEEGNDDDEDGGEPVSEDQEMPDAGGGDGGGNGDDDGLGGIQNAFARWKKVDAVKSTIGKQMSEESRAAEVRAVRAVRRSPRVKRIAAARA